MKCNKCGYDDNDTNDVAHVCGPVTLKPVISDRIKELWVQGAQSSWPRPGKFTAGEYDFHLMKFAELIIKECAELIDRQEVQSNYGYMLKEHFGVE